MVDGFSKIFRGRIPGPHLIKGIHQLNPQNLSSTTTAAKGKKKKKKKETETPPPPPIKHSTRNISLGYTEIEIKFPFKRNVCPCIMMKNQQH